MNIEDINEPEEIPSDILGAIFAKQLELVHKYHPIEKKNGLLQTDDFPVNLNDKFGQARLKDMAWRATEEITEATDCIGARSHYLEELIDALHFIVELSLHADFKPKPIEEYYKEWIIVDHPYPVIQELGNAMNRLKCKPWKVTSMLTDTTAFYTNLDKVFQNFFSLMQHEGLSPEDIYCLYFKKNAVNNFRIRSKY